MARGKAKAAFPTYYNVLHVSPSASAEVINAAFRVLVKKVHPDVPSGGDRALYESLVEAHDVLSDPKLRAEYDGSAQVTEGKVIGNYRILRAIAQGGFGTTYLGEHLIAREPVCIKHCHQVSPEYESMLVAEAKAIWDLRHFSLPVMRDFLRLEDNSLALVMSYIPGPTLEQVVNKHGRIDPESGAWILNRVLNALKYLHYHGVVHGDVKPQNIIVQEESHSIVLVDFGLAMVKPTRSSDPKGYTPVFSSPEQLAGFPLVPESDFYSLGMTMLFALGGTVEAAQSLSVPRTVPDELCRYLKRFIVREVTSRPQWQKEDLCDTLQALRLKVFGRDHSGMKPIRSS